jgi:hypothetical protein
MFAQPTADPASSAKWHVDTGRHTAAPILLSESSAPVFGNQDAIAQRCSPGLASNRSTVKPLSRCATPASGANRPSVTIRPPIPTPVQRVTRISAETDDLAKSGSAKLGRQLDRRIRYSGQKRDLRDPSPALLDGCNGLMTRSLNDPRRGSLPTVQPLNPCARRRDTCIRCEPTHPSPSAC